MYFFADDVHLVSMETSNAKKGELVENAGSSPDALAAHCDAAAAIGRSMSVVDNAGHSSSQPRCSCVNSTSLSPTHFSHCLLTSGVCTAASGGTQFDVANKLRNSGGKQCDMYITYIFIAYRLCN